MGHVKVQKIGITVELLFQIQALNDHSDPEEATFWAMLLTEYFLMLPLYKI